MANPVWRGGATPIAQVTTLTVGSFANNETFTISLSHPSGGTSATVTVASYTASSGGTTDDATKVADALEYLLTTGSVSGSTGNGSGTGLPNHDFLKNKIAVTQSGAVITLTSNIAGVPFIVTVGGTGTWTSSPSHTTVNQGPNDWNTAGNWSTGSVPVGTSDDVGISGNVDIKYGLNQSGVTDIATLRIFNYTGQIGYFGLPLRIDVSSVIDMTCNGRAYIEVTSTTTNVHVDATGGSDSEENPGLILTGAGTITNLDVDGGHVRCGQSLTVTAPVLTNVLQDGGTLSAYVVASGTITGMWITGGEAWVRGSVATITGLNINGGVLNLDATTLTNTATAQIAGVCNIFGDLASTAWTLKGGTLNTTMTDQTPTITTLTMHQAGRLIYNADVTTITNLTPSGEFDLRGLDYGRGT